MSQENPKQEPKIEEVENVSSRAIPEVKEELSKVASSPQRNLNRFCFYGYWLCFFSLQVNSPTNFWFRKEAI
ncbi:MAG UNVERIFIED_CONTAM: hypothetical protein LVQ98_03740 [Rickettsiaceae bacterium]